jgi:cytochrome c553
MVKILSISFVVASVLLACVEQKVPIQVQIDKPLPLLHIQPEVYRLGDIKEGETAVATFLVRNNHSQPIELVDIQASCGCTAVEPDSFVIMPHDFTQLQVTVDTIAKQSNIKKTISVKDSLGNEATALLTFNVVENPHLSLNRKIKGIFDGKCATCHFEPLVRQQPAAKLYAVGCAMCHGVDAEGGYAPKLRGYASLSALRTVISNGVGKPQMPGFAQKNGGPLTFEQITELSKWLVSLPEPVQK